MSSKSRIQPPALALLIAACWAARGAELTLDIRDGGGRPLQDAVIWMDPAVKPMRRPTPPAQVVIDQISRQFVPLVSILETGTEVHFPNSDNIRHSIYSFSPAKVFTTKLYSGRQAPPEIFDKPGLVVLGCNIHDAMIAWVIVVDTPLFAKSGANGLATIKGLGRGDYQLNVWYPAPQFEPRVSTVHVDTDPVMREARIDTSGSSLAELRARLHERH